MNPDQTLKRHECYTCIAANYKTQLNSICTRKFSSNKPTFVVSIPTTINDLQALMQLDLAPIQKNLNF